MAKKYLLMSLDDERTKKLADVLGNKSAKKIIDFLAETKQASETDLSKQLGMPLNTVEYNIKKLLEANLVEKAKQYFWSIRGKKIDMYQLSNKSILISPKSSSMNKIKTVVPVVIASVLGAVIVRYYSVMSNEAKMAAEETFEAMPIAAEKAVEVSPVIPIWIWFLSGVIFALIIYILFNWKKIR